MDAKIAEKLKDKSFVEKLMDCKTSDKVKSFLKSEGLTVSDDEIKEMGDNIKESLASFQNIPDSELEVAGGFGPSDAIGELGFKIGKNSASEAGLVENDTQISYSDLAGYSPEELEGVFAEGTRGKIGKALFTHKKGATVGVGAAAATTLAAYAGYKKGWPALKSLGQRRGWWN